LCTNSLIERENCQAYNTDVFSFWEASEKETICKNNNCRECDFYKVEEDYHDIKTLLIMLIP
jgi:hypothetical protein